MTTRARARAGSWGYLEGPLLLVPTMVGAVLTHLFIVGGNPAPAFVLGAAAAAIAWTRRRGR